MTQEEFWTWLKDGKPKGFFKTEHSLLISYDMMPLRGLDNARNDLNKKGQITTGYLVEGEGDPPLFVPFKNGIADIEAIDWGCNSKERDRCLGALCLYMSFLPEESHHNRFGISDEDNQSLRGFYWRMLSSDRRRRRPLTRLKPVIEAILTDLGFEIKSAKFLGAAVELATTTERLMLDG